MPDASQILKKAEELSRGRELSAKRDAFGYYVLYGAITGETKEAQAFLDILLAEEAKAGRKGLRYLLFSIIFRPKDIAEHTKNIRAFSKNILDGKSRAILKLILTDPMRTLDIAAYAPALVEYVQKEFKCPRETAFALVLFLPEWQEEAIRTRDLLLGRKESI